MACGERVPANTPRTKAPYQALSEEFEELEHRMFGRDGFDDAVERRCQTGVRARARRLIDGQEGRSTQPAWIEVFAAQRTNPSNTAPGNAVRVAEGSPE